MARIQHRIRRKTPMSGQTRRGTKLNHGLAPYRGIANVSDENNKITSETPRPLVQYPDRMA
jgi:hypothetical protein